MRQVRRSERTVSRLRLNRVDRALPHGLPRMLVVAALLSAFATISGWTAMGPAAAPTTAQDAEEAVMVAAGEWVLAQVPGGAARLDPHRSGAGKDRARVERVARSLGTGLATLDEVRNCKDVMDASTCTLAVERLLAIASPQVEGDGARVKVYAWYRAGSTTEPVAQRSWELQLRRDGSSWRVVSAG